VKELSKTMVKKKEEKLKRFIEWIRKHPGRNLKFYCEKMALS
jgi:hypothetical protein